MTDKKPINLTTGFKVVSYNGGKERDGYEIENILVPDEGKFHCSGDGKNFDLVLEYPKVFTLTNFSVLGPFPCTAPVKFGCMFVHSEKPNVQNYTTPFDDCISQEKFDEIFKKDMEQVGGACSQVLEKTLPDKKNCCFFETDDMIYQSQHTFPEGIVGKFIHIKFVHPHADRNIDCAKLGFVGFDEEVKDLKGYDKPIDLTFKISRPLIEGIIDINQYPFTVKLFNTKLCVIVITDKEKDKFVLKSVALELQKEKKFKDDYFFFASDHKEKIAPRLCNFFGLKNEGTHILYLGLGNEKYRYKSEILKDNIVEWIKKVDKKEIGQHEKSEERPKDDMDPKIPGLMVITNESFKELVLNRKDKDCFVVVYADYNRQCRDFHKILNSVAFALRDIEGIEICKFNKDANDIDKKFFPETVLPNIKLFSIAKKDDPVLFSGIREFKDVLQFLHDNCTVKFNVEDKLKIALNFEKIDAAKKKLDEVKVKVEKDLKTCNEKFEKLKEVKEAIEKLEETAKINDDSILEKSKDFTESTLFKELEAFAEKSVLKNVKKVHTDEDYKKFLEEAGDKLVIVDYFAEWCPPCKIIAPVFADLSEEEPDVVFIKLDVDKHKNISREAGITAMPTFILFKSGKQIEKIVGANVQKIRDAITKHK